MEHLASDLLAEYAFDTLESVDRRRVEAHLDRCERCQADLEEIRQLADGLLHLPPPVSPSAGVRAQLVQRLEGQADPARQAARLGFGRAVPAVTGALGVALVVLNAALIVQTRQLAAQGEALLDQQEASQTALALASYDTAQTTFVREERVWGTFVHEANFPVAVFNVWGLPALPEDRAYQLWLTASDGTRTSGALFKTTPSQEIVSVLVRSPVPVGEMLGFGITVEPEAGSAAPTGPRIIGAEFDSSP